MPSALLSLFVSGLAVADAAATYRRPVRAAAPKYLISFGDSYSQTGYDPTLAQANAANPIGNPAFPGYTTSGGKNWIGDYITVYNNTPIYSYNFASGGATTDAALIAPYAPTVLSLVQQVQQFQNASATSGFVKWNSSNALYAVWIGVNDVGNGWYLSNWSTLITQIMTQYFNQVQILYKAGARKFVFLQVPPIQYTPLVQANGNATAVSEGQGVDQYNAALLAQIKTFQSTHTDAKLYTVDTGAQFLKAINNPTAYGAQNNTCFDASGTVCLWWNNYHPGQAIQNLVAQQLATTVGNW